MGRPRLAEALRRAPLTEEYVAQAMRDARRFQANWDTGTSGTLAAHTARLIYERERLMAEIEELRRMLPGLPDDVLAKYKNTTLREAVPQTPATFDQPVLTTSSVPPGLLDTIWAGVAASREEMAKPREPIATTEYTAAPRRVTLIGMAGQAGAGKNSAAGMVRDAVVIQLADPLYEMVAAMTGLSVEQLRDREIKERPIEWLGRSPRELLQSLGTEWGREQIAADVWIRIAERRIAALLEEWPRVVVADVRFNNEAEMIRRLGGEVWQVVRPGLPQHFHVSEAGVSPALVDRTIDNSGDIRQLRLLVEQALAG
jgi:hypothetical protein